MNNTKSFDSQIINAIAQVIGRTPSRDEQLRKTGLEDLSILEIIIEIEVNNCVEVSDEDLEKVITVQDLIDAVDKSLLI